MDTPNDEEASSTQSREAFKPFDTVSHVWKTLGLPPDALESLKLTGDGYGLPSSFKVGHLAQSSIALSALAAALIHSIRTSNAMPEVSVNLIHAVAEFKSERLYTLNGTTPPPAWGSIGGLHKTADGYVRVHASFPNHAHGTLKLMECAAGASREEVARSIATWRCLELEQRAVEMKLAIVALRSYPQWDASPQGKAVAKFPIMIRKLADGIPRLSVRTLPQDTNRCLSGFRILEMSRVIAAPVAGKTLAAHGADVLWVTSPTLPDLPALDREFCRGKRTAQLDIDEQKDRETLMSLLGEADVFIQSFRPGSLESRGLSAEALAAQLSNGIICANLSAYGPHGPWSKRRGFDSLVQTCSGMNVSEAEHFGCGEVARPLPCQALDHAAGYFLATGIMAALYRRASEGGSYEVSVSLAGVMRYLRSLGQFENRRGFACNDIQSAHDLPEEYFETRPSGFGTLKALRHSAHIAGLRVGWEIMPKPLGSDKAEWLS